MIRGLTGLFWRDVAGRRLPEPPRIIRTLKEESAKGAVYLAQVGECLAAIKVRHYYSLRKFWASARGDSLVDREMAMLLHAEEAELKVPRVIGRGERRRWGVVVTDQAIVTEFLPGRRSLMDHVRQCMEQQGDSVTRSKVLCESAAEVVRMMAMVRRQGLSDRDFGGHNLIISERGPKDAVWIDLEAADVAACDDAAATATIVGSALGVWWWMTHGDEPSFREMWRMVLRDVPEPRGGWRAALAGIHAVMRRRVDKFIVTGWAKRHPPDLEM